MQRCVSDRAWSRSSADTAWICLLSWWVWGGLGFRWQNGTRYANPETVSAVLQGFIRHYLCEFVERWGECVGLYFWNYGSVEFKTEKQRKTQYSAANRGGSGRWASKLWIIESKYPLDHKQTNPQRRRSPHSKWHSILTLLVYIREVLNFNFNLIPQF